MRIVAVVPVARVVVLRSKHSEECSLSDLAWEAYMLVIWAARLTFSLFCAGKVLLRWCLPVKVVAAMIRRYSVQGQARPTILTLPALPIYRALTSGHSTQKAFILRP